MDLYKEFKVGDLFRLKSIRQIPRGFVPELKEDGEYPYLTQKTGGSYGVNGYIDETDELELIEEPMIVTGVDNVANGVMYWWDKPFYANKMLGLINEKLNRERAQYIITVLLKMYMGFDYNNKINMKIVRETVIQLPVKTLEDTEPDWDYMEEYIKQKELAYIGNLNQKFEQKKEQLIEIIGEDTGYANLEEIPTAKFKVGDLFEISNVKGVNVGGIEESKEGYPYITRTSFNNGVHSYTKGIPKVERQSKNTYSLGMLNLDFFYQKEEWYAGQYVRCITPRFAISDEIANYFKAILDKHKEVFRGVLVRNFDEMFLGTEIELPINPEVSDLVPDWNAMEKYIARIELQLLNRVINTLNT